jgi:tetratricopeptide (TPR) repeat protein
MLDCVQGLSEEDLTSTEIMPRQDGRPLWRQVVGNSFIHAIIHLAQIYNGRGDSQAALDIQTEATDLLVDLDDSPEWKGLLTYNLACAYSLSNKKERAVALLREGLAMNPGLTDYSKQDPDFDPIRETPEYLALYN